MGLLEGRKTESASLLRLLEGVAEHGGAVLLRGEAGIGKSSMLAEAAREARHRGFLVLRANGVQSESQLPFGGLHQLLRPVREGVEQLPARLRDALQASLGVVDSAPSAPYLIALATLDLLAEAAHEAPILLIADDMQWIDRPSADVLAFVARRLDSEAAVFLGSLRDGFESPLESAGLPEVRLGPLDELASARVLEAEASDLPVSVRRRVLDAARGNPLALVELPRALVTEPLDGATGPPAVLPLTERLERAFADRLSMLPAATRTLLVVAAVADVSTVEEVVGAGTLLDETIQGADALAPAVSERLIELDESHVVFSHPLVRSAIHQATPPAERRAAHAALARILAEEPDRRVWHLAASTTGTDEAVAAELEGAAARALQRGGVASAIDALEAAARIGSPKLRPGRLLRAAETAVELGRRDVVARLFKEVEPLPLESVDLARLAMLREMVDPGVLGDATRIRSFVTLADTARSEGEVDLALNLLWLAANRSFWSDPGEQVRKEIAASAERTDVAAEDHRRVAIQAYVSPIEHGTDILEVISRPWTGVGDQAGAARFLGTAALILGSLDLSGRLLAVAAESLRATGRLGGLARVLVLQTYVAALLADWKVAIPAAAEAERLSAETGEHVWAGGAQAVRGVIAALRGDASGARAFALEAEQSALPIGATFMLGVAQFVRGLTALAEGRDEEAYDHLRRVFDESDPAFHPFLRMWWIGDLAEAAARGGHREEGRTVIEELAPVAESSGAPWLQMVMRYGRALLADDDEAEERFDEALRGEITRWPLLRARALLAYGEWLRRQRRVAESRVPLRTARDTFDALGVVPWSERARRELRATGEASPDRKREAWDQLTPQELQIARLAAGGSSNREIGQQLYLSHRTVASHLYRIFPKLGITSRAQLAAALGTTGGSSG